MSPKRSTVIGLIFIVSCRDNFDLVLFNDAASCPDFDVGHYWQVDNIFIKSVSLYVSEQRDQDEVRRRFASVTYSDPLHWDRPGPAGIETTLHVEMISLRSPVGGDSESGNTCHSVYSWLFTCLCMSSAPPHPSQHPLLLPPSSSSSSLFFPRTPMPCSGLKASLSSAN